MQGWVKTARILSVVNKGPTYALVILITSRTPPQVYSDLTIEKVLPIHEDFKCVIGKVYFMQFLLQIVLSSCFPLFNKYGNVLNFYN